MFGQERFVAYLFCFLSDRWQRQPQQILQSWSAWLVASNNAAFEIAKEVYATKRRTEATESGLRQLVQTGQCERSQLGFRGSGFDECST